MPNVVDATFLANHDQNRVRSVLDSDTEARVAARFFFTLPGRPFVYYGEENGMHGKKPDPHIREPYLWTQSPDFVRADWIGPEFSTGSTVTPLRTQRTSQKALAQQGGWCYDTAEQILYVQRRADIHEPLRITVHDARIDD